MAHGWRHCRDRYRSNGKEKKSEIGRRSYSPLVSYLYSTDMLRISSGFKLSLNFNIAHQIPDNHKVLDSIMGEGCSIPDPG